MKLFDKIKENYSSDTLFLAFICFLAGAAFGFIASPVKNGIVIGSYNGYKNRITDSNKTKRNTGKRS